jgi:hypothetical protein
MEKGVDVDAVNGRVRVEMASVGDGGVRCKTTNGEIIVTVPASAKATIAARVTNGEVRTENLTVQSAEVVAPAPGRHDRRRRTGNPAGYDERRNQDYREMIHPRA